MLMQQIDYAVLADRNNFKYAWLGEHHCLSEYSHMSAPEVVMGAIAARTERIHLASGITGLPTTKEHPVRIAERAAMLDHITEGRFEFGTGRGAGSHEVAGFNGTLITETKAMWHEVVREIPRMWEQKDYVFHGEFFNVPTPHNVVPKPYLAGASSNLVGVRESRLVRYRWPDGDRGGGFQLQADPRYGATRRHLQRRCG